LIKKLHLFRDKFVKNFQNFVSIKQHNFILNSVYKL